MCVCVCVCVFSKGQTAENSNHIGRKHPTQYLPSLSFAMLSNAFLVVVPVWTKFFKKYIKHMVSKI